MLETNVAAQWNRSGYGIGQELLWLVCCTWTEGLGVDSPVPWVGRLTRVHYRHYAV